MELSIEVCKERAVCFLAQRAQNSLDTFGTVGLGGWELGWKAAAQVIAQYPSVCLLADCEALGPVQAQPDPNAELTVCLAGQEPVRWQRLLVVDGDPLGPRLTDQSSVATTIDHGGSWLRRPEKKGG